MKNFPKSLGISLILILGIKKVLFVTGFDNNPFDNKSFDRKVWLANPVNDSKSSNLRMEMSENLRKAHLKTGMTRQETRALLGKPDFENSYCLSKNNCDDYLLGEYVLVLSFDSTGKLVKRDTVLV